ncbi:hypothetical protein [Chitinibacter sp. S2-10]|uniref:COG4648 family protein n=1 Tax=Chitinibacter sp. S2-10 TaxID=3373597 RepID=UPI0039773B7B
MPSINCSKTKTLLTLIGVLLSAVYPLLVYFSLGHWSTRSFALILVLMAAIRFFTAKQGMLLQVTIILALAAILYVQNVPDYLRFYPVLINGAMLGVFASSLCSGPTVIERLARLSEPDLPATGVQYTRRVTQVWCGFFFINGSIALWTALFASWENWTLYNGLIAYLLMGLLLASEWILRQRIRKKLS